MPRCEVRDTTGRTNEWRRAWLSSAGGFLGPLSYSTIRDAKHGCGGSRLTWPTPRRAEGDRFDNTAPRQVKPPARRSSARGFGRCRSEPNRIGHLLWATRGCLGRKRNVTWGRHLHNRHHPASSPSYRRPLHLAGMSPSLWPSWPNDAAPDLQVLFPSQYDPGMYDTSAAFQGTRHVRTHSN